MNEKEPRVIAEAELKIRSKGQVTIPREIQDALHVKEGDRLRLTVDDYGDARLEGLVVIPADQRWYWTPEWQAGEREADEQIAAGEGRVFHSAEEMFETLERENPLP
ncbi:AbrB/MazE/SpoVT family DNA-binding domain-containing protein [Glycomyces salinus]|uniref:AbrB/MazE/SpoVT family DNA-binding domain-containing protein n=1 Tax=Glycomyces salinus TaxID=980294 RepID=UPI0018EAA4C8|nr:AbrB/MazE/SpoVT family DNA-binding domain-containing protein [Glycomyces salinus]